MRQFPKRLALSLLGGIIIQVVFFLIAAILCSPMLALVLLLPGWALVYAGRSSDPAWGWPVMVLTNAVIYAPLIYLLLYWKPFKKKGILSIRGE